MGKWTERTELLFGEDKFEKLQESTVIVVGIGGVGGYAADMIARSGVKNMIIIDSDSVHISNINRQLLALHSTIGQNKIELLKTRLLDINPELDLIAIDAFFYDDFIANTFTELIKDKKNIFVIDAIDTIQPKLALITFCLRNKIQIISSMGAGGKLDPEKIQIADISKTINCRLAHIIRRRLKEVGIYKGLKVVFSTESVPKERTKELVGERNKKTTVGTISYYPPIFGSFLASWVIRKITGELQ